MSFSDVEILDKSKYSYVVMLVLDFSVRDLFNEDVNR